MRFTSCKEFKIKKKLKIVIQTMIVANKNGEYLDLLSFKIELYF